MGDSMTHLDRLLFNGMKSALEQALVAMTVANLLPGVSAEYDFSDAIEGAREALSRVLLAAEAVAAPEDRQ